MADMAAPQLAPGWLEVLTEDGELYYWNEITNETTWERPEPPTLAPKLSAPPQQPAVQGPWHDQAAPVAAVPKGDVGAAFAVAYPDGLPAARDVEKPSATAAYQPAPLVSSNPAVQAALATAFPDGVPPAVQPRAFPAPLPALGGPMGGPIAPLGGPIAPLGAAGIKYPAPSSIAAAGSPMGASGVPNPSPYPAPSAGAMSPTGGVSYSTTATVPRAMEAASGGRGADRGGSRSPRLDVEVETAAFVDAEYTEEEGHERALTLQILTEGALLCSERWCVKEGSLYKTNRNGRKMYQFFLYNDAFIYADVSSLTGKYVVKREIPLKNIVIEQKNEDEPQGCCFRLMSTEKSFILECMNEYQKDSWVKFVKMVQSREGIETENADRVMAPIFVENADAADCMICGKAFGLLNRRHHCKKCGKCVCNACSYDKMRVPGLETHGRLVRCCIPCGNELKKNRSYGGRRAW